MQFNRRQMMLGLGAVLGSAVPGAYAGPSRQPPVARPMIRRKRVTAQTAPDAASRFLLERRLSSPWHGTPKGGDMRPQVARNFARIVGQNFAEHSPRRLAAWLDRMDATDLMRLGHMYSNSRSLTGEPALALDVLATRLDAPRLARLSPVFGFEALAESVNRCAPRSYSDFAMLADKVDGPVPFSRPLADLGGQSKNQESGRLTNFLDMTIEQTYLSFRTTPFVGMSVSASLFSTASLYTGALTGAWHAGHTAGSYLVWGAQRFTPSFWDLIVDGLGGWLYNIESLIGTPPEEDPVRSPEETSGALQQAGFYEVVPFPWEDGHNRYDDFYNFYAVGGGEFQETRDWAQSVPYSPPPVTLCHTGCQEIDVVY